MNPESHRKDEATKIEIIPPATLDRPPLRCKNQLSDKQASLV